MPFDDILSYLGSPSSRIDLAESGDIGDGGGVYCFWDGPDCLYVGESGELRERIEGHRRGSNNWKLRLYIHRYGYRVQISCVYLPSESSALRVESAAIAYFDPRFNYRRPKWQMHRRNYSLPPWWSIQ